MRITGTPDSNPSSERIRPNRAGFTGIVRVALQLLAFLVAKVSEGRDAIAYGWRGSSPQYPLMTFRYRQKTGVADTTCVAMLCMATTMLLGFSNPEQPQAVPVSFSQPAATFSDSMLVDAVATATNTASTASASLFVDPDLDRPLPARRPVSLAGQQRLNFILGGIDSGTWLKPTGSTLDLALSERNSSEVGEFRGVGFPDIRTYARARRSPFDPPGAWAPLVAWRTLQGGQNVEQPIASVRCMGLTPQAVAGRADRYRDMIYNMAKKYDVSPQLVKAVITEESCFNNKALSPVGAQGLMQLMPDTATWLDVSDPHDPAQNLRGGVRYLASLQQQFETIELALAAYNAGPGNVRRYKGVPPFAETQAYVVRVQSHYRRYEAASRLLSADEDTLQQASNSVTTP